MTLKPISTGLISWLKFSIFILLSEALSYHYTLHLHVPAYSSLWSCPICLFSVYRFGTHQVSLDILIPNLTEFELVFQRDMYDEAILPSYYREKTVSKTVAYLRGKHPLPKRRRKTKNYLKNAKKCVKFQIIFAIGVYRHRRLLLLLGS